MKLKSLVLMIIVILYYVISLIFIQPIAAKAKAAMETYNVNTNIIIDGGE